ncbi:fatty aldehyde dehydrogenase-like, partial [Tropilaelaps mercedesae]
QNKTAALVGLLERFRDFVSDKHEALTRTLSSASPHKSRMIAHAGNSTVAKLPKVSPNPSRTLYFNQDAVLFVNGGVPENTELLKKRFEFIFFTRPLSVGRLVYKTAQRHFTPAVLELRGKCPTYMQFRRQTRSCHSLPAQRQTSTNQFISMALRVVRKIFDENPEISLNFGRIVTPRYAKRLVRLIADADVIGDQADPEKRFVTPTIAKDVRLIDPLMRKEILAPILPVMKIKDRPAVLEAQRRPAQDDLATTPSFVLVHLTLVVPGCWLFIRAILYQFLLRVFGHWRPVVRTMTWFATMAKQTGGRRHSAVQTIRPSDERRLGSAETFTPSNGERCFRVGERHPTHASPTPMFLCHCVGYFLPVLALRLRMFQPRSGAWVPVRFLLLHPPAPSFATPLTETVIDYFGMSLNNNTVANATIIQRVHPEVA